MYEVYKSNNNKVIPSPLYVCVFVCMYFYKEKLEMIVPHNILKMRYWRHFCKNLCGV